MHSSGPISTSSLPVELQRSTLQLMTLDSSPSVYLFPLSFSPSHCRGPGPSSPVQSWSGSSFQPLLHAGPEGSLAGPAHRPEHFETRSAGLQRFRKKRRLTERLSEGAKCPPSDWLNPGQRGATGEETSVPGPCPGLPVGTRLLVPDFVLE